MLVPPKPTGYSTVSPHLIAGGAGAVLDFLQRVFGAEPWRTWTRSIGVRSRPAAPRLQTPDCKGQDPDRRGGFKDPAGTTWWVATQVG